MVIKAKYVVIFISCIVLIYASIWLWGCLIAIQKGTNPVSMMTIHAILYTLGILGLLFQIGWLTLSMPLSHLIILILGFLHGDSDSDWAMNFFSTNVLMHVGPLLMISMMIYYVHGNTLLGPFLTKYVRPYKNEQP